jgi:hypothetical protein
MGVVEVPWEHTDGTEPGPLSVVRDSDGDLIVHASDVPGRPWTYLTGEGMGEVATWQEVLAERRRVTYLLVPHDPSMMPSAYAHIPCSCGRKGVHLRTEHDAEIADRTEHALAPDQRASLTATPAGPDPYRLEAIAIAVHHHQVPGFDDKASDDDLIRTAAAVESYLRGHPRVLRSDEFAMYWREDGHHVDCNGDHDWSVPCNDSRRTE